MTNDPIEEGCRTTICSEAKQFDCEQILGGVWHTQSRCSPLTQTCETYTAINLAKFKAVANGAKVIIQWSTETEIDNAGFNIYRAEKAEGEFVKINDALIPATGTATQGASYSFNDAAVERWQSYYYKLEDISLDGFGTMHGPVSAKPWYILWQ
jgi:hypothetical protein